MEAKAVLFSEMTPPEGKEEEFNTWYDEEHIPLRMAVPGFAGAQRYRRNTRDYLAIYDMADPAVLASEAYQQVKQNPSDITQWMLKNVTGFTRYIGRDIGVQGNVDFETMVQAPVLYPVFFQVPEDRCAEFDDWYDQDHVPALLKCPEWLGCRRFALEKAEPTPFNRLALHYISDRSALESPARAEARESDWRKKLAEEPWFKGSYMIFDRHNERFHGSHAVPGQ